MSTSAMSGVSGATAADLQASDTLPASTPANAMAAERFKQLLQTGSSAQPEGEGAGFAEPDVAQWGVRAQARSAAWQFLARESAEETGPARRSAMPRAFSRDALSDAGAPAKPVRDEGQAPARHEAPRDAGAANVMAPSLTAPGNVFQAHAAAPVEHDAPPAASVDLGELEALLSRHCQAVYVGADAAGAGRVMLRLSGAFNGVSVEIASGAAGLSVRMHLADPSRWPDLAARAEALERQLARESGVDVRVEPVFDGGRS